MVDAEPLWSLPKEDFIKVNVHSFFSEEPLENGTLKIQERRLNEFYAILYRLRKAFFENFNILELESDHAEAYWGWRFEPFDGVIPEHQYVVRQINTMKHGARTWDRMMELEAPLGRVKEIWYNDMGLGPIGPQFETVRELDLAAVVVNEDGGIVEDEEMI
ncbi:hypothetical protein POM88_013651 [Heracleum sosnowskyi]|uniref:Uncharacterized protein n=1 Tax=Heracleum sosnowskyi TaxID=360622 RepID=A0AAD8IYZ2_9APIA|nr:hypothetical protein POM88_013651 [Heracleum sosnowskyi]